MSSEVAARTAPLLSLPDCRSNRFWASASGLGATPWLGLPDCRSNKFWASASHRSTTHVCQSSMSHQNTCRRSSMSHRITTHVIGGRGASYVTCSTITISHGARTDHSTFVAARSYPISPHTSEGRPGHMSQCRSLSHLISRISSRLGSGQIAVHFLKIVVSYLTTHGQGQAGAHVVRQVLVTSHLSRHVASRINEVALSHLMLTRASHRMSSCGVSVIAEAIGSGCQLEGLVRLRCRVCLIAEARGSGRPLKGLVRFRC